MILTLKELAEYLRVTERTILRMLKTGKIKGDKIGGQWRFNGSQIDKVFFPSSSYEAIGEEVENEDDVPFSVLTRPHIGIPVSRMLNESRMVMKMEATDVESALKELVDPRFMNSLVLDVQDLLAKCLARENVLSTGVGNGFAIPHPRDPVTTLRAPACIIYGHSDKGIDYKAVDDMPVHDFFLICSQNIELHLHLMGCMARMLRDDAFVKGLPKCKEPKDVIRLAMEHERAEFSKKPEEGR